MKTEQDPLSPVQRALCSAVALIAGALICASSATAAPKKSESSKEEPKISAEQAAAKELVSDLTTTQKSKMLDLLNEGEAEELAAISGISETRAKAIIKERPFDSIDEVILVKGIGSATFDNVIEHARSLTQRGSSSASTKSKSSSSKSKS